MRMKEFVPICFLLLAGIPLFCESFDAATISTEVTPEERAKLYGKRTKFDADEFNYRHLGTITVAYRTSLSRDSRMSRDERNSSYQELKTLLDPEDNRFYGVLIRSYISFTDKEAGCSVAVLENDQKLPGQGYYFPIQNGSEYWYYYIYKLDEPREGTGLVLEFTYPDSRKQLLRLP